MGLDVRNVTVTFGGHRALDDVSIDAPDGMITGLIGPNGAGKTTLFNVVTGVQQATAGHVELDGRSLDGVAPHQRARRGLARSFQRLELFGSLTVRENVRVAAGARARRERAGIVDGVLDRLHLGDLADVRADSLSTGVGRILELARCLVTNPTVLLLDEPASGQDDEESATFAATLTELAASGMAVLLVEHDMDLVMRVCDRLHVLDFGHLLASGTPATIQADAAVRAAYLGDDVTA